MPDGAIIALITGALAIPGAWFAARAASRKADVDLLGAVDARIAALIDRLNKIIDAQEIDLAQQRAQIEEQASQIRELRGLTETVHTLCGRLITELRRYDPTAADGFAAELPPRT